MGLASLPPTEPRLWVIGGTSDSRYLAQALVTAQIPCIVTVTTPEARRTYGEISGLQVWVGTLVPQTLPDFLQQHEVQGILDASHPFAVEISRAAMAIAQAQGLPYLRFERPALLPPTTESAPRVLSMASVAELLTSQVLLDQRVLLTLGYRWLPSFASWQDRSTLFARILPSTVALQTALQAGFTPDRLIALRPPISVDLERALWRQWQLTLVVTKASGLAGGEASKRQVAAELNLSLVVIERPAVNYPEMTDCYEEAIQTCCRWWATR